MSDLMLGFCEPSSCPHACFCSCHRLRFGKAAHLFACCNPCGLCERKIRIGSENEHNENCHKPISQKMPVKN